eukprot:GCRY01002710.1.p1 GENE.GCRY01002710.1~~GCRY01002710.1.p1  ORF type:complete len:239 (+),score=31.19 GCRY01002710.1:156-872(+)
MERTFLKETTFFGVTPEHFFNSIINAVNDYLCDSIDALENALLENAEENSERIVKGCDELLSQWQASFDRNFDKFEMYILKNILHFPETAFIHTCENETHTAHFPTINQLAETQRDILRVSRETKAMERQLAILSKMETILTNHCKRLVSLLHSECQDLQHLAKIVDAVSSNLRTLSTLIPSVTSLAKSLKEKVLHDPFIEGCSVDEARTFIRKVVLQQQSRIAVDSLEDVQQLGNLL